MDGLSSAHIARMHPGVSSTVIGQQDPRTARHEESLEPRAESPSPAATAPAMEPGPAAAQPIGISFAAAGMDMPILPLTPSADDLAA